MGLMDTVSKAVSQLRGEEQKKEEGYYHGYESENVKEQPYEKERRDMQKASRHAEFEAQRRANAEQQKEHEAAEKRKQSRHTEFQKSREEVKENRFQAEQERWNLQQKQKYADEQYRKEQEEVQKKNRMPTFQERATEGLKHAILKPALDVRKKNYEKLHPEEKPKEESNKPLTKTQLERILRQRDKQKYAPKQPRGGKMTVGQFHAPMFGPNIPSGGVGKKMNFDMGSAFDFHGFGGTHGKKKSQGKKMSDWFKF